jgi:hypothetical protein
VVWRAPLSPITSEFRQRQVRAISLHPCVSSRPRTATSVSKAGVSSSCSQSFAVDELRSLAEPSAGPPQSPRGASVIRPAMPAAPRRPGRALAQLLLGRSLVTKTGSAPNNARRCSLPIRLWFSGSKVGIKPTKCHGAGHRAIPNWNLCDVAGRATR